MLYYLLMYLLVEISCKCPCVPILKKEFKICGWQINEGGGSGCNENDIYKGCENINETGKPGKILQSCPNECFFHNNSNIDCGICLEYANNGLCTNVKKITKVKEKIKIHRPKMKKKQLNEHDILTEGNLICVPPNVQLELMFVLDGRSDYNLAIKKNSFLGVLQLSINDIVEKVEKSFPTSRFGLSSFVDWPERTNCVEDYCYELNCNLNDWDKYKNPLASCVNDIKYGIGMDRPQSSMTALYYTALDKQVGWTETKFNKQNQRIIKVMVLTTNGPWISQEWIQTQLNDPLKTFPTPIYNNQTCHFGPPTIKSLAKVLKDKQFSIIALIGDQIWINKWNTYVTLLNHNKFFYINLIEANQPTTDIPKISNIIINAINSFICNLITPGN